MLDFGFVLSATEDVAKHRDDSAALSRIMSAVLACKLLLGAVSLAAVVILCSTVSRFRQDPALCGKKARSAHKKRLPRRTAGLCCNYRFFRTSSRNFQVRSVEAISSRSRLV